MLLQPSSDQEAFRETTEKFLRDQVPVATLRTLRDDPQGFNATYWRRGAELGWTSLLVSEEHGGGSISGAGLVDLTLVAYEFGRAAAPGPLAAANVVAGALSAAGGHDDVLSALLGGEQIVTWAVSEPVPHDRPDAIAFSITEDGDEFVLNGVKRPVESAAVASHLLVTGRTGDGLTQVLVATDTPGISIEPMRTVELTRRFDVVRFDNVRVPVASVVGQVGKADEDVARQMLQAITITNAESVGAMQSAFDLTLQWLFDRYSFGRPLASYQALKHRMAEMKVWVEASHAISDEAAAAVAKGAEEGTDLSSAAKAYIGTYGSELMQECVQFHGGLGVTFEHDIHIYMRRQVLNRTIYGTPEDHLQIIADGEEQREAAAK
jgi:alkylation response protein AidB-like acyl-CoA dehydrogenase